MDEIQNKSDREILVMVHTMLQNVVIQQTEIRERLQRHEIRDAESFKDLNVKLFRYGVGTGSIGLFIGWAIKALL